MENFRCSKQTLEHVVDLLRWSSLYTNTHQPTQTLTSKGRRRTRLARAQTDPPTLQFKVAACLYCITQGGPLKVKADVCSIGESTLRRYVTMFADAVIEHVRPKYMPAKPFDEMELNAVRHQFAVRRGIDIVTLACDGTHIPHRPKNKRVGNDYRNYKGWTSILAVCFVDSFYRFFDVDVGYPGRAGDNTVLANNWLLKAIHADPDKWLGTNGVILGDSGASDGDNVFMNPYHCPSEPDKLWFNFCHSSTRFFAEQVMGVWKSRFRCLLDPLRLSHKLTTKIIYCTAILHNLFTTYGRLDAHGVDMLSASGLNWAKYFTTFKEHRCMVCKMENKLHCIHQGIDRVGSTIVQNARNAPSVKRDEYCKKLWDRVCEGPNHQAIAQEMRKRRDEYAK
jgi:hypothetical protein